MHFMIGLISDEIDTDRFGKYGGDLFVSLLWLLKECFRALELGDDFERTVDDNVEELEVLEDLYLLALVDDLEDDMLRDFSVSKELLEILLIDGVLDGDDKSLDARYALNCCSDSAGVIDRSGLRVEFLEVGNVSFHISS